MQDLSKTTDPDYCKTLTGYISYLQLFLQSLTTPGVSQLPVSATDLLMFPTPLPVDALGSDFAEKTVTSSSATATDTLVKTFVWNQVKAMRLAGVAELQLQYDLELAQVDAGYAGSANITQVVAALQVLDTVANQAATIGTATAAIAQGKSAVGSSTFSCSFLINLGATPVVIDATHVLQVVITATVTAVKHASATTNTIAKARLRTDRGMDASYLMLPVV